MFLKIKIFCALLVLSITAAKAGVVIEPALHIERATPTEFTADNYGSGTVYLFGSGFFSKSRFQDWTPANNDILHTLQVTYRQVYPTLGNPQVINMDFPTGPQMNWISAVGPNRIDVEINGLMAAKNANTSWSFNVCAIGVGCSNSVTINIRGPGAADINILTGSNPIDFAVTNISKPIAVSVKGLSNNLPLLKIGKTTIWGDFNYGTARFVIPETLTNVPNYFSAAIIDPNTGITSESFPIRIFGVPAPKLTGDLTIIQNLNYNQQIQDVTLVIPMEQMTFPASANWEDGNTNIPLNVPLDLLTNKAKITIPANILHVGKYIMNLRLSNIAGSKIVPVYIDISKVIINPIPNPVPNPIPNPIPVPNPRPTPIPVPRPPIPHL